MTPVLIFTDTEQIAKEKKVLNDVVVLFQSVYDALHAINIPVTLQEISNLVQWTVNRNGGFEFEDNFVVNKILDAATSFTVNGVPLTREGFKSIMAMPNTQGLKDALKESYNVFTETVKGARINLLALTTGVVAKVNNSDSQIEALYTYFTKTDASATLANALQLVCDANNTFNSAYGGVLKELAVNSISPIGYSGSYPPAIKSYYGTFVISLEFIRAWEGLH